VKLTWYTSAFVTFRIVSSFRFTKKHYENKAGAKFVVIILPFLEVTFIDCREAKKILVSEFFDKQSYIENLAYYDGVKEENYKREVKRLEDRNNEMWKKNSDIEKELSEIRSAIMYSKRNIKELYEISEKITSK
jgi:hypothetical protein